MGPALTAGQVFAGYRIERLLAVGSVGEVYLAHDRDLPRYVALKVLTRANSADPNVRERFRREADTVARLSHPHIGAIFARGEADERLWISMQYIDGSDVAARLRSGPLEPSRAVRIIAEVAQALDYAHDAGVLHRDVKPGNILLARGVTERAILVDFGIAVVMDDATGLTRLGEVYASFQYAAPERFYPLIDIDRRADVYSLGCTLHHMLTGLLPYPGVGTPQLIQGHLHSPIPQPSRQNPGVPASFDEVIARALAKDRDERFSTCGELATSATAALTESRTPHPSPFYEGDPTAPSMKIVEAPKPPPSTSSNIPAPQHIPYTSSTAQLTPHSTEPPAERHHPPLPSTPSANLTRHPDPQPTSQTASPPPDIDHPTPAPTSPSTDHPADIHYRGSTPDPGSGSRPANVRQAFPMHTAHGINSPAGVGPSSSPTSPSTDHPADVHRSGTTTGPRSASRPVDIPPSEVPRAHRTDRSADTYRPSAAPMPYSTTEIHHAGPTPVPRSGNRADVHQPAARGDRPAPHPDPRTFWRIVGAYLMVACGVAILLTGLYFGWQAIDAVVIRQREPLSHVAIKLAAATLLMLLGGAGAYVCGMYATELRRNDSE
ncbi:protein kinase [Nocardia sp. NPDC052566]|uniref:serine/threonine-protein kinase n=1 Tax=Nocardia sp. NPDC052566 TaxID=3364330 RepID=UPI0037CA6316